MDSLVMLMRAAGFTVGWAKRLQLSQDWACRNQWEICWTVKGWDPAEIKSSAFQIQTLAPLAACCQVHGPYKAEGTHS